MSDVQPNNLAIRLAGLHKSFRKYHATTIKETLTGLTRRRGVFERRQVLQGVDLVVERGERIGIIGRNGAGKSTLFRVMSGILRADKGAVELKGRVSPLIELTAGFVPDLSGAENIRLNALMLGVSRKRLAEVYADIVAFADLGEFLDTPVRYYSSGMHARLGFAVAVHVDADILLVDEVLAVGDLGFQRRCVARLSAIADAGATIVFVSHDLEAVARLCRRVVWLDDGKVRMDGAPDVVCAAMVAEVGSEAASPS